MFLQTASIASHLWLPPLNKEEMILVHPRGGRNREDRFFTSQYAQALNAAYMMEGSGLALVSVMSHGLKG